jgi:hypothetical protein
MGYNTIFRGELKFINPITVPQIAELNKILGEDLPNYLERQEYEFNYIDLVFTESFDGLRWNDATEKTYGLENAVNFLIMHMRKQWPDFGLSGKLDAQGESPDDRWVLTIMENGAASKVPIEKVGTKVICPKCRCSFTVETKS